MFVPKKGGKLRIVINYKSLNTLIVKNRYLLLNIEEIKDRLIELEQYSKIDLYDVFYVVRIVEDEEQKTIYFEYTIDSTSSQLY